MKSKSSFYILVLFIVNCGTMGDLPPEAVPPSQENWQADPDPLRYELNIREFEKSRLLASPLLRPIIFVGSSSFTRWEGLSEIWPGMGVLNRGTGGTHMSDLVYNFDRLVTADNPRQVFVYEGDNDLAGGKPLDQVESSFKDFGKLMKTQLPGVPVVFMAAKPSPSRWKLAPLYREFHGWLKKWAESQKWVFIDTWSPILGPDGTPNSQYFEADQLHLNRKGYDRWIPVIGRYLLKP